MQKIATNPSKKLCFINGKLSNLFQHYTFDNMIKAVGSKLPSTFEFFIAYFHWYTCQFAFITDIESLRLFIE